MSARWQATDFIVRSVQAGEPWSVLTGGAAAGTPAVLADALARLGRDARAILPFGNPLPSPVQLQRAIADAVGLQGVPEAETEAVVAALCARAARGAPPLLLAFQDCDAFPAPTLRYLWSLQTLAAQPLPSLQMVMVGQPAFWDTFRAPGLEPVASRITARFALHDGAPEPARAAEPAAPAHRPPQERPAPQAVPDWVFGTGIRQPTARRVVFRRPRWSALAAMEPVSLGMVAAGLLVALAAVRTLSPPAAPARPTLAQALSAFPPATEAAPPAPRAAESVTATGLLRPTKAAASVSAETVSPPPNRPEQWAPHPLPAATQGSSLAWVRHAASDAGLTLLYLRLTADEIGAQAGAAADWLPRSLAAWAPWPSAPAAAPIAARQAPALVVVSDETLPHLVLRAPWRARRLAVRTAATLGRAGYPIDGIVTVPGAAGHASVGFFFAQDRDGASAVARLLDPSLGSLKPQALPMPQDPPPPGTIEIQFGDH